MADPAPPISLTEYSPLTVELADEDADFIVSELSNKIQIRRGYGEAVWVIDPGPSVGLVALPSGRRMEISTKVPVESLFFMLSVAAGFPPSFRQETVPLQRLEEILEFLARYLADLVDERIRQGLFRSYVVRRENLTAVRGRISFADQMRRNNAKRHQIFCEYAVLSWDVPENQVVLQTIHMLAGWDFSPTLRKRLRRIESTLAPVSLTALPPSVIDEFGYHRFNDDYQPIHRLCRLFLEGSSLSEHVGTWESRAFLIDMNRLFEAFVERLLLDGMSTGVQVGSQFRTHLDLGRSIRIRPDLVFRLAGSIEAVGDSKYKVTRSSGFENHDLYQVISYATSLGCSKACLFYPAHEMPVQTEIKVRTSDLSIRRFSIDLGVAPAALQLECRRLADSVESWCRSSVTEKIAEQLPA